MKYIYLTLIALVCFNNDGLSQNRANKKPVQKKTIAKKNTSVSIDKVSNSIDLGLSVKWAEWDLGSNKPEIVGEQYAWGCTKPQKTWNKKMYTFYNSEESTYTKYYRNSDDDNDLGSHRTRMGKATWTRTNPNEDFGRLDVDSVLVVELDSIDDIAKVKWKNGWRMPTCDELKELKTKCEWEVTTVNNIRGYKVTGPNGNSIFLPGDKECQGGCWSSEAPVYYDGDAYGLSFNRHNSHYDRHYRYCTMSIRPVIDY